MCGKTHLHIIITVIVSYFVAITLERAQKYLMRLED